MHKRERPGADLYADAGHGHELSRGHDSAGLAHSRRQHGLRPGGDGQPLRARPSMGPGRSPMGGPSAGAGRVGAEHSALGHAVRRAAAGIGPGRVITARGRRLVPREMRQSANFDLSSPVIPCGGRMVDRLPDPGARQTPLVGPACKRPAERYNYRGLTLPSKEFQEVPE